MAGAVTPVKDQGACSSSWAFSATGGLEGTFQIHYGPLLPFSEQQLIDCSAYLGNTCSVGSKDEAFFYTTMYGIETEIDYPYTGTDGTCKYEGTNVVWHSNYYHDLDGRSEQEFLYSLSFQPLSIGIDASAIMPYSSGIFNDPNCGTNINHGALAVGYLAKSGYVDYVTLKNSWGTSWGDEGYIYMALLGDGDGECGMYTQASYPYYEPPELIK